MKKLQIIKKEKKEIRKQTDILAKNSLILQYKELQNLIHDQLVTEKTEYIEKSSAKLPLTKVVPLFGKKRDK